jgi:hypothetical protein
MPDKSRDCWEGWHRLCVNEDCQCVCHGSMHRMTIDLGNLCGMPTADPRGRRASSAWSDVTCRACTELRGGES